uniref:Uncharacterized protein n=3 Tax=Oryza brachyantha TaxID=4533 RepID=J3MET8_ORYBR
MVAVAAEAPIRADAVAPDADAPREVEEEVVGEEEAAAAAAGKDSGEEVREYKSDARKLEELFKKLNPSAEEFVPLSRRR